MNQIKLIEFKVEVVTRRNDDLRWDGIDDDVLEAYTDRLSDAGEPFIQALVDSLRAVNVPEGLSIEHVEVRDAT